MRKLDRSSVPKPPCLATFKHGRDNWDDVKGPHKQEIHAHLEQMQGRLCAYCEGSLDELGQHIEHFRQRDKHPTLTFDWANLFWSCTQDDSCGRFKDMKAGKYNPADLLDPCLEDPDRYFLFRSDGTISLRTGLSGADERKATETLRIFNLETGRLRFMRQRYAAGLVRTIEDSREECEQAGIPLADFLKDELVAAATQPFFTVIRHLLTKP